MTMATAYCWMTASPASVHRPFPIRCCAGISAMRFYPQKRNCMRTFSNSVLITAPSAERLLCQTPTGKNTARRAAKRAKTIYLVSLSGIYTQSIHTRAAHNMIMRIHRRVSRNFLFFAVISICLLSKYIPSPGQF